VLNSARSTTNDHGTVIIFEQGFGAVIPTARRAGLAGVRADGG
jgi:hypothetical protein